jgi:hypothetical protein
LPADVGISQAEAAAIANEWDTMPRVNAMLKMRGMQPNIEPDIVYTPVTVEQLTTPDLKAYTVTYTCQLRWYNYSVRLLAEVRAELLGIENQMSDIARSKRTTFRKMDEGKKKSERMSASEMEDLIEMDPLYRSLKLQQQEVEQTRMQVDAWAKEMDESRQVVSRQISNRKSEAEGSNRENNMPGHATGTWDTRRPGRRD